MSYVFTVAAAAFPTLQELEYTPRVWGLCKAEAGGSLETRLVSTVEAVPNNQFVGWIG